MTDTPKQTQVKPSAEAIWLEPEEQASDTGPMWCADDQSEGDVVWTKYVRADLVIKPDLAPIIAERDEEIANEMEGVS